MKVSGGVYHLLLVSAVLQGNPHLCEVEGVRFLVLDEADRMVERAHYQDLWSIMDRLKGASSHGRRRNLLYSATLTISRRITEQRGRNKATSQQDIMGQGKGECSLEFACYVCAYAFILLHTYMCDTATCIVHVQCFAESLQQRIASLK